MLSTGQLSTSSPSTSLPSLLVASSPSCLIYTLFPSPSSSSSASLASSSSFLFSRGQEGNLSYIQSSHPSALLPIPLLHTACSSSFSSSSFTLLLLLLLFFYLPLPPFDEPNKRYVPILHGFDPH